MNETAESPARDTRLFKDIFDASPVGIAVETLDGQPLFVNAAFCSFLGFNEEELRRKHCVDFSPPEDAQKDWELFQQLKAGLIDHYQLEKRYFRCDGSLVWGRLNISLLKSRPSPLVLAMVEDITEEKKAAETLRESDQRLRLAALAGKMFAYEWDAATDVIMRSADFAQVLGNEPMETTGQQILARTHPDDRERVKAAVASLTPENPHLQITYRMARTDGTIVWLERASRAHFDEQGKMLRLVGMMADITERKQAEEALKESEQRFRLVADTAPALIWMSGTDKVCTYLNKPWLDFTGRSLEEELTNGWAEGVHPDDVEKCLDTYTQSFDRREKYSVEYRLRRYDGEYRWILDIGVPRFNQDGSFAGYIGIGVDVTERKQAEQELGRANERLHLAIEAGSAGGWEINLRTGKNVWFGKAYAQLGMTPDQSSESQEDFRNRVHEDDRERVVHALEVAKEKHEEFAEDFRVVWQDGTTHWLRSRGRYYYSANGEPERMLGISLDITNRKRAEEALQSSERRYRLLFERNVAGVGIASLDGRLLDCNDGWARILGYESKDELLGRHASEFYFNPAQRQPLVEELFKKQVLFSRELQLRRKDGTPVWVLFNAAALHSDHDTRIVQATMVDISEGKRAEEALSDMTRKLIDAQEQERSRIGRELHDDINQRLAMLSLELEQLQDDPTEVKSRVSELRKQIADISNDVQALSHDLHSSKLEYLGVVAGMKSWCKEFAERHKIQIDFKNDVPTAVPLDIGLPVFRVLQQALDNATKHSGVRRVDVQLHEDSSEIHLIISDSGKGFDIESALQSKGLGLTSMRERIRLVNGTISIKSEPMGGTTIHVRVPLDSEQGFQRQAV